jgi:hypothetical protein
MRYWSIPPFNGWDISIVAHDIHCSRIEKKKTSVGCSKPNPPRGKSSDKVTVGEYGHIALRGYCSDSRNDTIYSSFNLIRTFSARAAVGEKHPPRPYGMDLLRS